MAIEHHSIPVSENDPSLPGLRPKNLFGLPCANCKAYFESDLTACPVCGCNQRVSVKSTLPRLVAAF